LHHLVVSKERNMKEKRVTERTEVKEERKKLNKQRKISILLENKEESKETNQFYS